MDKLKLIAVVGPTASGKTALAVRLAQQFGGEIVSADSMQIYKGMPIATAVPSIEERGEIEHHLMEFLQPEQRFTVADYVSMAHRLIAEIHEADKLPIIVGGTGLYIDSLLQNVTFGEEQEDPSVREALLAEAEQKGIEVLYSRLAQLDSAAAARIHPNDQKRIVRALETFVLTGRTQSDQNAVSKLSEPPYEACIIGLRFADRQTLYSRINRRVDLMLENGLLCEARESYIRSEIYPTASAAIGHKELFDYFSGKISLEEAVENLKQATRRYAKRQMTWFNRNSNIHWINMDKIADPFAAACDMVGKFI